MERECGNCVHWQYKIWQNRNKEDDVGYCLRFPPVVIGPIKDDNVYDVASRTFWPAVSYVCVCGEWQPDKATGDQS